MADELRDFIAVNYQYESVLSSAVASGNSSLALTVEQANILDVFNASYAETLQAFLSAASAVDAAALGDDAYDKNLTDVMAKHQME